MNDDDAEQSGAKSCSQRPLCTVSHEQAFIHSMNTRELDIAGGHVG